MQPMDHQVVDRDVRAVVLVEGASDRQALLTLARRHGRDLATDGIAVLAMGGASSIGHYLDRFGPHGADLRLAGLCDVGEEADFRRGLERVGLGVDLERSDMERLGFHVCDLDLEDELIRSLGTAKVERLIAEQGELSSFHTFQAQPEWRGRPVADQLRRFLGTRSGRKVRYGRVLVEALDLAKVPHPLGAVLDHL